MKHLFSLLPRVRTLLCALAGACCLLGASAFASQANAKHEPGGEIWLAASNKTLDRMRGGFDIGAGLMVSFGVARSISINGSLIVTTSFNIPNLSMITSQQAALITQQLGALNLIQNGPGNSVQPPAPSSAPASPPPAGSPAPGSVTVSAISPDVVAPGSVTLGSVTVGTAPISGAALGTFIQNTLNNQNIQNQTVINASTNGLGLLKGMNFLNTLNAALKNAFASH